MTLLPPNPSVVSFDNNSVSVGMYGTSTVNGTELTEKDEMAVRRRDCSGETVTVGVGTPIVNDDGTQWARVVRFNGTSADGYVACYTKGGNVMRVDIDNNRGNFTIRENELHYELRGSGVSPEHQLAQYELLGVSIGPPDEGMQAIEAIDLIDVSQECNYAPFYEAHEKDPEFNVTIKLEPNTSGLFFGRLRVAPSTYALCVNTTSSLFLVRTTSAGKTLSVFNATPSEYSLKPVIPFVGQSINFTFFSTANLRLSTEDSVRIINGTLYECGLKNVTSVGEYNVTTAEVREGQVAVATDVRFTSEYVGQRLTVCYRRNGGSYATVEADDKLDLNIAPIEPIPSKWTSVPLQPQAGRTLVVTFHGNESKEDMLSPEDEPKLILKTGSTFEPSCDDSGNVVGGNVTMDGMNSVWTIPAEKVREGSYVVCYTSKAFGATLRVKPDILEVYETQSPKSVSVGEDGSLTVFIGERFYMKFETDVSLTPELVYERQSTPAANDEVLLSKTRDCKNPLTASNVAAIPKDFGFIEKKDDPKGAYLHLVMGGETEMPGEFYICMRRSNRGSDQAFFDFETIGDLFSPAFIKVTEAPISNFTIRPAAPRAWVPQNTLSFTFGGRYNNTNFSSIFFVTKSESNRVDSDLINNCFRPTKNEAIPDGNIQLLEEGLQVDTSTGVMRAPFENGGSYHLCLRVGTDEKSYAAPVYGLPITVKDPSPRNFTTAEILLVNMPFQITFEATDPIFSEKELMQNDVRLVTVQNDDVTGSGRPSCVNRTQIEDIKVANGKSWTRETDERANWTTTVKTKSHLLVCFRVSGQDEYFSVPNSRGGHIFSVGLSGARRYFVDPSTPYMGQQVNITVLGSRLGSSDRIKVVEVTKEESENASDSVCYGKPYEAESENDGGSPNHNGGHSVNVVSPSQTWYQLRVNKSGRFIVCYKNTAVSSEWDRLPDLPYFDVGEPHPSGYELRSSSLYVTEQTLLNITDTEGKLAHGDKIKLVERTEASKRFVCTEEASGSKAIEVLEPIGSHSNANAAAYRVCAKEAVTVAVCYALKNGTWAEVPAQSSPNSYVFKNITFSASPFSGFIFEPESPRPFELFQLSFNSSVVDVSADFVKFAQGPQRSCDPDPPFVAPAFYHKNSTPNRFSVAMAKQGSYQLYIGTNESKMERGIAHQDRITIAPCNPCGFAPSFGFIGSNITLKFKGASNGKVSGGKSGLSLNDTIILANVTSEGDGRYPCDSPEGPLASKEWKATSVDHTSGTATFLIPLEKDERYVGDYYICYKRADTHLGYSLVPVGNTLNESTFSVYPDFTSTMEMCPSQPLFLETMTFTLSYKEAIYSKILFTKEDEFSLRPQGMDCSGSTTPEAEDVIRPTLNSSVVGKAQWEVSLPSGHSHQQYTLCIKPRHFDRNVDVTPKVLSVNAQEPSYVVSEPPLSPSQQGPFKMFVYGKSLTSDDTAYLVAATEPCNEKCGETLAPTQLPGAEMKQRYMNESLVELTVKKIPTEDVALCYRRQGRGLVRSAYFLMHNTIPFDYVWDFVPRVGTRPKLTFRGNQLSEGDRMAIVKHGRNCDPNLADAVGIFYSLGADSSWATFYLPLTNAGAGLYTVCYRRKHLQDYVQMRQPLEVFPGGPSRYQTSNNPMLGRATEVTFPNDTHQPSTGDEAMITCPNCNCFDGESAALPYGQSYGIVSEAGGNIKLRVGMEAAGEYPVCYRVSGSGFAQVGAKPITPVPRWPNDAKVSPSPTYQGQRAKVKVLGTTADELTVGKPFEDVRTTGSVMIVSAERKCWETYEANGTGVFSHCENVNLTDSGKDECSLHVPSLGPNVPPQETVFPLDYTVCYREANQSEFVAIVPEEGNLAIQKADPSSMETHPKLVSSGMKNISMKFPNAAPGDTASIVKFEGPTLNISTPCDNTTNEVAVAESAYPTYLFGLPSALEEKLLVVCYTKAEGTVAEVPQLLELQEPNPSGWETIPPNDTVRFRQYFNISFGGVGLDPAEDSVVFSDEPCDSVSSLNSTSQKFYQRVGQFAVAENVEDESRLTTVAQLVAHEDVTRVYVCYRRGMSWINVGSPLSLKDPVPQRVNFTPPIGKARVGHHIYIKQEDGKTIDGIKFDVISASEPSPQSWCHNYTAESVLEPHLQKVNESFVEVPVWRTGGPVRLCVRTSGGESSDVSLTPTGNISELHILGPNPASFQSEPAPPRVGQQVTLRFKLVDEPGEEDLVRIAVPNATVGCDSAQAIVGLNDTLRVTKSGENESVVTLISTNDTWNYSSFVTPGRYSVCYYSANEGQWSLIGGSSTTGEIEVRQMAPNSWKLQSNEAPHAGESFILQFNDLEGALDATGDLAWAVPKNMSCGDPLGKNCLDCINLKLDRDASTSNTTYTTPSVSFVGGEYNVCYQLRNATPILLPESLTIKSNGVKCIMESNVTAGEFQKLTFFLEDGATVGNETWRVSTYDPNVLDCSHNFEPDFVEGRSGYPVKNETTMSYDVEWPVSMTKEKYRICFNNSGVGQLVCPCTRFLPWGGDCYLSVLKPKVAAKINPKPVYVGQTVKLNFSLTDGTTDETLSNVKFVKYHDGLTVCNNGSGDTHRLFDEKSMKGDLTDNNMEIELDHSLGPMEVIICANLSSSSHFTRVSLEDEPASSQTLNVRPYLKLGTSPEEEHMIRAGRTLQLTFGHASREEDDVVGDDDEITFVRTPEECREAKISGNVINNFYSGECSFSALPAKVRQPNNDTKTSSIVATFENKAETGLWYVCYKLQSGTWAPVFPPINLSASAVQGCSYSFNGEAREKKESRRVLQYVKTTIRPQAGAEGIFNEGDKLRVVPKKTPCFESDDTIFEARVTMQSGAVAALTHVQKPGDYKFCYQYGDTDSEAVSWSPVCEAFDATPRSPTVKHDGCLRLGQTLTFNLMHSEKYTFNREEVLRFVSGNDECIDVNGKETYSTTVKINGAEQTINGTAIASENTSFTTPPVYLGNGTQSLRLCYKDKDGNHFLVPFDMNGTDLLDVGVSGSIISSVSKQGSLVVGERPLVSFIATTGSVDHDPGLKPYGPSVPFPYEYGPEYNGTFDVATALVLENPASGYGGYCFMRKASGSGVYGNATKTVGAIEPKNKGTYLFCYRSVGCSVEDVGTDFRVYGPNPTNWTSNLTPIRRGQLFDLDFDPNSEEDDSPLLSEGDLYAIQKEGISCWNLLENEGAAVIAKGDRTKAHNIIIHSEAPSNDDKPSEKFVVCYRLKEHTWTEVANRPLVVEPANPSSFNVKGGAARALQVNTIEFRGTNLGKDDRVKIVRSSDLCSNTSEPPNGITPHPRGNGNSVSGASSGWPVASATSDTALIVISSETTGVYTVCYRLADDAAWTRVYGNLTILPRIPVTVSQTPEEAAEGQLFTLNFTVGDELPNEGDGLTEHDQVKLYVGNVSCAQPGRDPDVIATSPSRTDHLPYNLTFQMASGTRGEQTLCYVRNGSVVWGFEPITIRPNPWSLITHPMAPTPTRANHLVSMVFTGFGLASGPEGKADEVRLVSARNPRGDESCYQEESDNLVHYYPLEANGTHSVQTIRITPQWMGSYWVCYKLNGGKFRMMLDNDLKVIEPDPFHAMSAKGSTVMDGELTTWAIMSTSPPPETALVFYSSERCNDFRYYEDPGNALGEFPHDVAYVKGSSASLRARKSTGEDESLSLCYLEGRVTSLLVEKAMRVIQGTPPILKEPVQAIARNIFNFTLDVDPTDADYVVLVDNPAACVGLDPPASSSDLFTYLEPASGKVRVTTAVEREGAYHICYSHPTGDCQVGGSRECARVVGTVIATAADPSGWSMDPTTVYTTDLLQIKLSRQHINALLGFRSVSPPIAEETLWLVPLEDKETANMKDVALACMSTVHGGGTPMQPSVHQKDLWTVRVMHEGSYGLCFLPMGMELPAIFPPRSSPGPVVLPSVVENVTVLTTPSLGINSLFNLEGKGLTTDDEVVAVGTSGVTPPNDVCTNTTYKPRVNGSFAMKRGQGLHSLLVEFQFPVLGRYVICFRSNASTGDMKLITAESFAVENSLLTFNVLTVPLVNTPLVLEFRGVGLVEEDEAALVADTGKKNGDPCNTGKFKRVDNVSGDGATAFYNSTPHEAGNHVVCFRKQDSYILQLPTPISVADRTATKAEFRTQPVCKASKKCSQQPLVALVNSSGGAASDPTATVYMRLKNEEGKYVDDLLSGGNTYSDKDHSTFQFLELAVSEPGTYVMEANFNLSGGVTIRGSSSSFKVDSDPNPVDPATLSCIPKDIIPRATLPDGTSDMNVNVSCKITAGPNGSPTSYIVTVTGGSHTEVTPDKPSGGPPTYSFTAFPPHDDPKTELIYITVTANVPAGSVPVKNSPVRMFIGSKPEPESTLQCKSSTVGLPQPWMVRQKDQLKCSAQGKRKINGTEENVVALPKYFHFVKQYNNDSATNNPIAIGSHPDNEEGAYLFNVSVDNISQSISVLGSISNDDTSGVQTPMKGSPASFAVIGDPRKGESGVTCVSKRTSSEHWYSPSEQLRCTLTLVADGKPVLGVPHDFVVNTPGGGDVKPDDVNALGSTLYYSGTAPPAPTADMKTTEGPDYLLSFTFLYKPSDTPVASTSATLVFVRAVTVHNESNSTFTSLTLAGSGLSTGHRYGARRTSDCSQGVEATSIVKPAENESGSLHMQVNYGGGLFYLCFAPSDRTESWGTLVNGVVDNSAPGDAQLDTWFFLLIGGVILLFVLLVLLVVLVWHLCKGMRRDSKMLKDFVYMRPRPNDRFTSAAPGTPAASQALNASGKVRSLSLRKNSGGRRNGNHSRTDDGVNESANTNYSVVEQVKADPAPIVMPNTKQVKEVAAKNPSGDGSKTGSTETYEMKIIPTVPPPKPPPSEASASDASLRREQSTTDRQGSTSVGSASTAQPKDDQRGLPPIQPRPPQLGSAQQPKPLPSIIPTTDATTTDTIGDSTNGNHSWVGPFMVMGYTSRPVINQAQQNDDLRKGPPPTPQSKANDTTAGNKS
ncbi:uncharacterized protein TEOVI_000842700 [Trypanosoma equiperdum]|uniref:Uncharacterized protein n=1 Tax=Trypanosoma equiperdum TaxID=5694 RepID=A0A1G4IL59_TRYEQ|nr:hypothetical protein TEOVI_000842700 [Trypanosoma equiperdum]